MFVGDVKSLLFEFTKGRFIAFDVLPGNSVLLHRVYDLLLLLRSGSVLIQSAPAVGPLFSGSGHNTILILHITSVRIQLQKDLVGADAILVIFVLPCLRSGNFYLLHLVGIGDHITCLRVSASL